MVVVVSRARGGVASLDAGRSPAQIASLSRRNFLLWRRVTDLPHTASRRPPPRRLGVFAPRCVKSPGRGQHPLVLTESPDLELTLPARAENVAVVRHALGGVAEVVEVSDQAMSDIKLAVTEACTNVVVHAYPDGEGPLRVGATVTVELLTVVVRDEGQGIVPRADSPGLGLGLPLIATLAESLELGKDDEEHTEVRMSFRLDEGGRE